MQELTEAGDELLFLRMREQISKQKLLTTYKLGFVPLTTTGEELLFKYISQPYERGSISITSNLPLDEWTEILGSELRAGTVFDRPTQHLSILQMIGDSYRSSMLLLTKICRDLPCARLAKQRS
ncbi:MAG: ATP-binding protein [Pseudomonadota bacterium]